MPLDLALAPPPPPRRPIDSVSLPSAEREKDGFRGPLLLLEELEEEVSQEEGGARRRVGSFMSMEAEEI